MVFGVAIYSYRQGHEAPHMSETKKPRTCLFRAFMNNGARLGIVNNSHSIDLFKYFTLLLSDVLLAVLLKSKTHHLKPPCSSDQ